MCPIPERTEEDEEAKVGRSTCFRAISTPCAGGHLGFHSLINHHSCILSCSKVCRTSSTIWSTFQCGSILRMLENSMTGESTALGLMNNLVHVVESYDSYTPLD